MKQKTLRNWEKAPSLVKSIIASTALSSDYCIYEIYGRSQQLMACKAKTSVTFQLVTEGAKTGGGGRRGDPGLQCGSRVRRAGMP